MSYVVWAALAAGLIGLFFLTRGGGVPADLGKFQERGAVVLDVRTPGEFAQEHVKDAINIPVDELQSRLGELTVGPIIIYCRSGMRSRRARAMLEGAGFEVLDMRRLTSFPPDLRTT